MASAKDSSSEEGNTRVVRKEEVDEDDEDGETGSGGSVEDSSSIVVNPTRDALQEGILGLIRPTVEGLDQRVGETVAAQAELRAHIEALSRDLEEIQEKGKGDKEALELEAAINKLNNSKKRVVVVANILQGAQDRLNRVHQSCLKETAKRRTLLEPSPASSVLSSVGGESTSQQQQ